MARKKQVDGDKKHRARWSAEKPVHIMGAEPATGE
jgi:hypothetical protein